MKKTCLFILIVAVLAAACSKGDSYDGSLSGGHASSPTAYSPARAYMLRIADDLVTENLDMLENALYLNRLGTTSGSTGFKTGGADLETPGTSWEVTREGNLKGLTLTHAAAADTWILQQKGDYTLGGDTYATSYTLSAVRKEAFEGAESHFSWVVTLEGSRTEQQGYSCTFVTYGAISYQAATTSQWRTSGVLGMTVYKKGTAIDRATLTIKGNNYEAEFRNGL